MVKINLLPQHVVEKRKLRSFYKYPILIIAVEVVLLFLFVGMLSKKKTELGTQLDDVTRQADEVRKMQEATGAEQAAAAPFTSRTGWYNGIYVKNKAIADTLEKVNEFLYADMTVRHLSVSGASVQVNALTRDIDHVAKAYLNLLRSPYIEHSTITYNPGTPNSGGAQSAGTRGRMGGPGMMRGPGGGPGMGGPGMGGPGMRGGPGMGGPMMGPGMMSPGAWSGGNASQGIPGASTDPGNPNESMPIDFTFALKSQYGLSGGGGGGAAGGGRPGMGRGMGPSMGPGGNFGAPGGGMGPGANFGAPGGGAGPGGRAGMRGPGGPADRRGPGGPGGMGPGSRAAMRGPGGR